MGICFPGSYAYGAEYGELDTDGSILKSYVSIKINSDGTCTTEENYSIENSNDENVTLGMKNALASAKNYLDFMSFSYNGLIEQLEYEQYTHDEAVYGADNCGADWNEQAARCAQEYLDYTSFSRQELIDQLLYEGFTQEQAEYGVEYVGY